MVIFKWECFETKAVSKASSLAKSTYQAKRALVRVVTKILKTILTELCIRKPAGKTAISEN